MTDSTAGFFDELSRRGHEPLLEKATGTIRFDLRDGTKTERWLVTLVKGDVLVSRRNIGADCVVRMDRTLFEGMVQGDLNGMAAYLRGALTFEGDPELLVLIQRALPEMARPTSLVDGNAAAAPANDAGPRPARRSPVTSPAWASMRE